MGKYANLYLAEKPDIGRAIAGYLWPDGAEKGKGFIAKGDTCVSWAFGHILGLAQPEEYGEEYKLWKNYPILPKTWKLHAAANCQEQLKVIRGLLKESDTVIHAGDPDREGQLLIDEILKYFGYKGTVKRLLIHAKDAVSLARAFDSIEDNKKFEPLYAAGLGRERADWLIGMNLTRAYTVNARRYGYESTFRIGRVKIPTLALVVQREEKIQNFQAEKYYEIEGDFQKDGISFKALWKPKEELLDEQDRIKDKSIAQAILMKLGDAAVTVDKAMYKDCCQAPPLPYSLDMLQEEANRKFGYSPKDVLDTVQALYEKKLVSYPRSDCSYIPVSQQVDSKRILPLLQAEKIPGAEQADASRQSRAFNDQKVSAHHAIIPTGEKPGQLTEQETRIYQLIAKRYVLQFLPEHTFQKVTFTLLAGGERFAGSGKLTKELGFRQYEKDTEKKPESSENLRLPELHDGEAIAQHAYAICEKKTTPPKRFTEGTLLAAMANIWRYVAPDNPNRDKLKEVKGIGTPATRDTIIAELQAAGLKGKPVEPCLRKTKNELVPTAFGIELIHNIAPSLTVPDITAEMEYKLTEIAAGRLSLMDYTDQVINMVHENIQFAEQHEFPEQEKEGQVLCPICGQGHLARKFSPKTKKYFYVCSDPACVSKTTGRRVFFEDDAGHPLIAKCPHCGEVLVHILKNGNSFWLCAKCSNFFNDVGGHPDFKGRGGRS